MTAVIPKDEMHTKPLINLLRGWPSTSLLPTQLMQRATNSLLSNKKEAIPGMLYGPDEGDPRLRKNVASWLTTFYKHQEPIAPERITITGGASQSLACLLQTFSDPIFTRNIWLVAPAYMLAFRIFEDSGFHGKLRAVPEDEEGIDIKYLRQELRKSEEKARADRNNSPKLKPPRPWSKTYRHFIYAVPTFSNPSSKTMSLRRREDLVRVAREFDALVVTDDVYDMLCWRKDPQDSSLDEAVPPRLVDVDRYLDGGSEREGADGFGNTVSNMTVSKIAGPGLRTGFVEGTEKLAYGVSQTGSSRSGGSPSQLTACFVAETLQSGELQEYVGTLQPAYASRWRTMMAAIEAEVLPLGVTVPQPDRDVVGGYFIWLTLPSSLNGTAVAQRAKEEENLIVAPGELFEVPGDTHHPKTRFTHDLRLCFAWEDEAALGEGVRRLANVIRSMQTGDSEGLKAMQPPADANSSGKDTPAKAPSSFW
ncbi:PLP-dependent transferase [Lophium mytilinum]|uniref:PLP-dependent transferase n=1 Tax=Lophium mytilinum TaxID=390894 RepID=A0A6A6QI82_9PEZI|nr:PLP-dependent transferase [Lophium mytilinum]